MSDARLSAMRTVGRALASLSRRASADEAFERGRDGLLIGRTNDPVDLLAVFQEDQRRPELDLERPAQFAPNSMTLAPRSASISARGGSVSE
jgi:hypothetical protein